MTVGFKPLCSLFSQFMYLRLKSIGNLTVELELVHTAIDCIIDPCNYDESDAGNASDLRNRFTIAVAGDAGKATNTSMY